MSEDQEGPALCKLCGDPMPKGEEMFFYHGYSGPCPKPPLPPVPEKTRAQLLTEGAELKAQLADIKREAIEIINDIHDGQACQIVNGYCRTHSLANDIMPCPFSRAAAFVEAHKESGS